MRFCASARRADRLAQLLAGDNGIDQIGIERRRGAAQRCERNGSGCMTL
jgi:hypothetical protein